MPFQPRFRWETRDRTVNGDGTPRTTTGAAPALPVLSDDDAAWTFDGITATPTETDDADEWARYLRSLERAPAGGSRNVGARWWCGQCSAFITGASATCAKCRHSGPHHFGEDSPLTGGQIRRAQLKARRRATRTIHN